MIYILLNIYVSPEGFLSLSGNDLFGVIYKEIGRLTFFHFKYKNKMCRFNTYSFGTIVRGRPIMRPLVAGCWSV